MNKLEKQYLAGNAYGAKFLVRPVVMEQILDGTKLNVNSWAMRDSIAKEIAPKIALAISADNKLSRIGRPLGSAGGKAKQTAGKGSISFYSVATGDNGNGMEDNCPLWTMGEALAQRDAAKA